MPNRTINEFSPNVIQDSEDFSWRFWVKVEDGSQVPCKFSLEVLDASGMPDASAYYNACRAQLKEAVERKLNAASAIPAIILIGVRDVY